MQVGITAIFSGRPGKSEWFTRIEEGHWALSFWRISIFFVFRKLAPTDEAKE